MKKTQILAALALAMALGVVAPVAMNTASVFAATQTQKDTINAAIKDAKSAFKTIHVYYENDATTAITPADALKGADAYAKYYGTDGTNGIAAVVTDAKDFLANLTKKYEGANGAVTKAVKDKIRDGRAGIAITTAVYNLLDAQTRAVFVSANDWTNADLNTVISTAKNKIIPGLVAAQEGETAANIELLEQAIDAVNYAISSEFINDATDAAVVAMTAAKKTALQNTYKIYTNKELTIENAANLKTIISGLESACPDIALYNRIATPIKKLEEARDGVDISNAKVTELINKLKAAAAGTTTPSGDADKDEDTDKDPAGAPDSGILGTAEGTATTVSIVAGLATALTALGAGVVAYRSARRK